MSEWLSTKNFKLKRAIYRESKQSLLSKVVASKSRLVVARFKISSAVLCRLGLLRQKDTWKGHLAGRTCR